MKYAFFAAFIAIAQIHAVAADSAYTALRTMAKERGDDALDRVVEVRGRQGKPQPQVWRITTSDPQARGGLREMEIQRGKVISQRTPVSRPVGSPLNLNQLNLDSDGVFQIVNQETDKLGIVFDRIDYALRSGTRGGAPVWTTELYDKDAGRIGLLEISADSGTILRNELNRPNREVTQNDREYLEPEPDRGPDRVPPPSRDDRRDYADGDDREFRPGEGIKRFFNRVDRHFQRRNRQFENFFTGRGFRDDREGPDDRDDRRR